MMDRQIWFLVALGGLCWGSFLNMLAYRVIHGPSLLVPRSRCPGCQAVIAWYDNIPLLSWIVLRGRCRSCAKQISSIYPVIEVMTAVVASTIYYKIWVALPGSYPPEWAAMLAEWGLSGVSQTSWATTLFYGIFFSGLLAATAADLRDMLIPQLFSTYLVPTGLLAAALGYLPLTFSESVLGALAGYGSLWIIAYSFKKIRGIDGVGVGDMELLMLIGAYTGLHGVWVSLTIGSLFGLLAGGGYLLLRGEQMSQRIPFGPFLAIGAYIAVFWSEYLWF